MPNRTPPPDTSVWRPIVQHIFERVSYFIAGAATDSSIQVWSMTFPSEAGLWPRLHEHLQLALRSRMPTDADSSYYELEVGPLTISGDTARLKLHTGLMILCPGTERRGGYGNEEEIVIVKRRVAEFAAWRAVRPVPVEHGDRFGCR